MTVKFNTPEEAEIAFYEAIERADLQALGEVWSLNNNIVCIHPGSHRIEGRAKVLESFSELFADSPAIGFTISDALQTESTGLAIHLVREEIELDGELAGVMVSTNIYHVEDGGWRMLLHHSSHESEANGIDFELDQFEQSDTRGHYNAAANSDLDRFDLYDEFDESDDAVEPPPVLH